MRISLHTRELVQEMEDFFGGNMIMTARIADQAQSGEILVSPLLGELTTVNRVYRVIWGLDRTT